MKNHMKGFPLAASWCDFCCANYCGSDVLALLCIFRGSDATFVFVPQQWKAIKCAGLNSCKCSTLFLERSLLTSSALHSLTFPLPSRLVVLGDIVEWLWFIFTFQAFALSSLSLAVCWRLKLKGNLRTSCSLTLALCPLHGHTSRWICFDAKKQNN